MLVVTAPGIPYHHGANMATKLLTDKAVKAAKPKGKPYRRPDGGNLYLYVSTTGVKSWQFRYRLNGAPCTFTIGKYPRISLELARVEAERGRAEVDTGRHLTTLKRAAKLAEVSRQAMTFERVAAAWLDSEESRQRWTPDYKVEVEASLRNHLHRLDALPVSDVTALTVAPILRGIQHTAPLMLAKVHRRLRGIMDYAVEEGLIPANPLPQRRARVEGKHYAAVTDLPGIGEILRAARSADPCKGIQRAHVLLAFCAMRVSEIVGAQWSEFDLERAEWSIPRDRMKRKDLERGPHVVPLAPALLSEINIWRAADGPEAVYVCAAPRDAADSITPEGIEKFYRRSLDLAGKHSPHSWRSAFSTICREAGKSGDVVESQLDHVVGNKIASAYDRAARLELRRDLMAWYESTLIAARDGAAVLPLRKAAK